MSKYSLSFKQSVVEFYGDGERSYREVGLRFGLDHSMVRKWVASHAAHGVAGLCKKFSHYDAAFRLSVLERMWKDRLSRRQAAALFNIRNAGCLSVWERQYERGGIEALAPRRREKSRSMPEPPITDSGTDGLQSDEAKSREELVAELAYLRMENAYLKKPGGLSAGTSNADKAQAVQALRPLHPLDGLLKLSGLARSTFYYQQKTLSSADRHAALKTTIRSIFEAHKGRYGYRRVTAAIRGLGEAINHKTVQRLMVEMGLKSLVRPKKYRSYKGQAGRVAPDLLQRQFTAERMNQKWTTDVTEFNVAGEKLYLSPVMDLYNGEIVAFETARRPIFKLVQNMLTKALDQIDDDERPILHSDQGWHYQMPTWNRMLESRNIAQSMSRKGNRLDNAAMESFFATLKSEFFHPNRFDSIESLKEGVEDDIRYYNNDRIRLKLKGLSPVQYRTQPLNLPSL
ncbi:IS3 family transposase [Rhizobium leguminosarum]|uniref:IS3 family transposase n=1 Tax=Rhizobium leguminosarum TaxID=384 RepID=UPI0021B13A80|nr:IS3 family transposase [Rhizobium leguminosarum]